MDFKQLEAFILTADLGSFSKAAEQIGISQPSVSAYIGALERETGAVLISRTPRDVALTAAGRIFYDHAYALIGQKEALLQSMNSFKSDISGTLSIAASSVPAQYILPVLMTEFGKRYPVLTYSVTQMSSSDVCSALSAGTYELGFTGAIPDRAKYEALPLLTDELVLITPDSAEYRALTNPVRTEDLLEMPFISREKGSGTSINYTGALARIGVKTEQLKAVASFSDTGGVLQAVRAGLGISVVSGLAASQAAGILIIPTVEPLGSRGIYAVKKKGFQLTPAAGLFMAFAQERCSEIF